jgi:hypothetical protein
LETNKSSGIGDDEPWELEDSTDEKLTPIPTTVRLSSPFNDDEYSTTEKSAAQKNFFSDSFIPPKILETRPSNEPENSDDDLSHHQSNETTEQPLTKSVRFDDNIQNINRSEQAEIDDMETSYINVGETDVKAFQTEQPFESIQPIIEDLPSQ